MTTKFLTLDVWNKEDIKVKVNQGEVNARFLEVQFIDKNQPLNLEDKRVFFFAKKPDGNLIFNRCEIVDENDGKVNLALTSQMSIVDGIMQDCEFDIIATDLARLKVKGLILEIEKCTDFDSATESTSEFTALEEAMAGYERASDTIDAHIADKNNPHEVTAAQVGAAESIHTHSTNDITSGTLPIARGGTNATSASNALSNLGGVPTTRTINSKALSSNITLDASDVGAAESNHTHSTNDITSGTLPIARGGTGSASASTALTNLGGVPNTRTINSKALSSDITLDASDVGAPSYEVKNGADFNNMKTPGLYTMINGSNKPTSDDYHSLIVNKSYYDKDYEDEYYVQQIAIKESTYEVYMRYCINDYWSPWKKFSMDGHSHATSDITSGTLPIARGGTNATSASNALSNLGGVPTTRTINSKALSSNITLDASDVGAAENSHSHSTSDITSGTLPIARGGTNAVSASEALTNLGAVPTFRTVNSKDLSDDISLTYSDVGALAFSNIVQEKVYLTGQQTINSGSTISVQVTNPFQGKSTYKVLGATDYYVVGTPPGASYNNMLTVTGSCGFVSTFSFSSIKITNYSNETVKINPNSYILFTAIKP